MCVFKYFKIERWKFEYESVVVFRFKERKNKLGFLSKYTIREIIVFLCLQFQEFEETLFQMIPSNIYEDDKRFSPRFPSYSILFIPMGKQSIEYHL